jgi:error-prone DNA polymerase
MVSTILPLTSSMSFRRGVASPAELAAAAAESGFGAAVLADRGGLYGYPEFARECGARGVEAIPAASLEADGMRVVAMARRGGWSGLCRLVTAFRMDGLSGPGCLDGHGGVMLMAGSPEDAAALRRRGFGGPLVVAVGPSRAAEEQRAALEAGFEPVAVWPAMFTRPRHHRMHAMARAADLGVPVEALPPGEVAGRAWALPAGGKLERAFSGCRRALAGNRSLPGRCMTGMPPPVPREPDPDAHRRLRELAMQGLEELYAGSPVARSRAEMELARLRDAGLSGYVLAFAEIAGYCRRNGIAAAARGSAAGSLVCRLAGISVVCPIRYGLGFSRFFNRLRPDPPDIDLDVDSLRRDEVMEWFLGRMGERAGSVAEVVTLRRRGAFRAAAAAHGLGAGETGTLAGLVGVPDDPVWSRPGLRRVLEESKLLAGLPWYPAPHPCGLVCTSGPLAGVFPLEPAGSTPRLMQAGMDDAEAMGLLKMDLLGQRGLSTIGLAARAAGRSPVAMLRRREPPGEGAQALLRSGRTIGVVHVESPAMRGLLRRMGAHTVEGVARALALVRPGAAAGGGRQRYLRRLREGQPRTSALPRLEEALRENLGVMLYQEDVSLAATELLGLDGARADLLRRRLKSGEAGRSQVMAMARAVGMGPRRAERVWEVLSGYAGYGFCRAHAFTYAAVACIAAGLKAESPAVHFAAVLAAGGGFYRPRVYAEEARRMGVELLPPGVETGDWESSARNGKIMLGFRHLRNMGGAHFRRLREARPCGGPEGLAGRGIPSSLLEAMALAGCFGELGITPGQALWRMRSGGGGLFEGGRAPVGGEYSLSRKVGLEMGLLGVPLSASPLALVGRPSGTVPARDVAEAPRPVLWGRAVTRRRLENGSGFLMVEDDTGVADIFVPAGLATRLERLLRLPDVTLVIGCRREDDGRLRASGLTRGPMVQAPLEH